MGEIQQLYYLPPPPLPTPPGPAAPPMEAPAPASEDPSLPSSFLAGNAVPPLPTSLSPRFDPSRMIGIIRRKALIKDLAAVYHAECLTCCQELLELQKKLEAPSPVLTVPENPRKETMRPPKRLKKTR